MKQKNIALYYTLLICVCFAQHKNLTAKDSAWYTTLSTWYSYIFDRNKQEKSITDEPTQSNHKYKLLINILQNKPTTSQLIKAKETTFSDEISPITFAISVHNYKKAYELITQGYKISPQDFYLAELLMTDPQQHISSEDHTYLSFFYHRLLETSHTFIKPALFNQDAKKGLEINSRGEWTPEYLLCKAAQYNDAESINELVTKWNINPNETVNCLNPLEIAIIHQNINAINELIRLGAQPTQKHIEQAQTRKDLLLTCYQESRRFKGDPYPGPSQNFTTDVRIYTYIIQRLSLVIQRNNQITAQASTTSQRGHNLPIPQSTTTHRVTPLSINQYDITQTTNPNYTASTTPRNISETARPNQQQKINVYDSDDDDDEPIIVQPMPKKNNINMEDL